MTPGGIVFERGVRMPNYLYEHFRMHAETADVVVDGAIVRNLELAAETCDECKGIIRWALEGREVEARIERQR